MYVGSSRTYCRPHHELVNHAPLVSTVSHKTPLTLPPTNCFSSPRLRATCAPTSSSSSHTQFSAPLRPLYSQANIRFTASGEVQKSTRVRDRGHCCTTLTEGVSLGFSKGGTRDKTGMQRSEARTNKFVCSPLFFPTVNCFHEPQQYYAAHQTCFRVGGTAMTCNVLKIRALVLVWVVHVHLSTALCSTCSRLETHKNRHLRKTATEDAQQGN